MNCKFLFDHVFYVSKTMLCNFCNLFVTEKNVSLSSISAISSQMLTLTGTEQEKHTACDFEIMGGEIIKINFHSKIIYVLHLP